MKKMVLFVLVVALAMTGVFAARADWNVGVVADVTHFNSFNTCYATGYAGRNLDNGWRVYGQFGTETLAKFTQHSSYYYMEIALGAEKAVKEYEHSTLKAGVIVKDFYTLDKNFVLQESDYDSLAAAGTLSLEKGFESFNGYAFTKLIFGARYNAHPSTLYDVVYGQLSTGVIFGL